MALGNWETKTDKALNSRSLHSSKRKRRQKGVHAKVR